MLKLMVGPLYGENPSYGIRELMQNAIDLADLESRDHLQHRSLERPDLGFCRETW